MSAKCSTRKDNPVIKELDLIFKFGDKTRDLGYNQAIDEVITYLNKEVVADYIIEDLHMMKKDLG